MMFFELSCDDGIILPIDKGIRFCLVLHDTQFRIHIVLHLIIIPIQMIGGDVQKNGDVRLEVIHIIQLETAQLDDIHLMRVFRHLQRQAVAHIASQAHIQSGLLQDMIGQHGRGRLAVAARDTDHLG